MSKRPPREGARWGDDPAPGPAESKSQVYLELCKKHGEENVKRALQIAGQLGEGPEFAVKFLILGKNWGYENVDHARRIHRQLARDYPDLRVLKRDEISVVMDILARAKNNMDYVSQDGRPHSMPETLSLMEKQLGKLLALSSAAEEFGKVKLVYGDEGQGRMAAEARQAAKKEEDTASLIGGILWLAICAGVSILIWIQFK